MKENKILQTTFSRSTNLIRADYDPILESLTIYFKNGGIYEYCGVEKKVFDKLIQLEKDGESIGHFFFDNIKNKYAFQKKI